MFICITLWFICQIQFMKAIHKGYIKCLGVLALTAALIALIFWTTGMYRSSKVNYLQTADQCLAKAADGELRMRIFSLGDKFITWTEPSTDTSTYITKTIRSKDTVIYVHVRRDDPTAMTKIRQFYFHLAGCRLNPSDVDSLFKVCMTQNHLPTEASYVELIDFKKNSLISSNAPEGDLSGYIVSNTDTLDILKTLGLRVYIKAPAQVILRPVMAQFILSIVLSIIALVSTLLLVRNILHLRKEGFHILSKVAQTLDRNAIMTAIQMKITADEMIRLRERTEQDEAFERLYEQLHDANSTAGRLWRYLDNEEGKIDLHKFPIKIKPVFDELKAQFERIEHKKVSVSVRYDNVDIMLNTDELYFSCIIEELMRNAVNFSDDPVHIDIRVQQIENKVVIFVRDNGWGIPKDELAAVFQFPHRIKSYVSKLKDDRGVGVGLSFIESFIGSLGGSISVISVEGDFTIFELVFPQTQADLNLIQSIRSVYRINMTDDDLEDFIKKTP